LLNLNINSSVWVPHCRKQIDTKSVYEINSVYIKNYHPRKSFFKTSISFLKNLINVNVIIIENDIASIMLFQLILYTLLLSPLARKKKPKLIVSTFENFDKNYALISRSMLFNLNIKLSISYFILYLLIVFNSKFIDCIFVYSNESEDIHRKNFKKLIIKKFPLGIEQTIFNYNNYKKNNIIKTIGFLGRVVEEKNARLVIEIFNKYADKYKLKLIIQDPELFKNKYASQLNNSIKLLKRKYDIQVVNPSHDEMSHYLKMVDLLLVPSVENEKFKEQYGRVVVEGKLCGCIVLVSSSGALPEVLGSSSLVIENNNYKQWLIKVEELLLSDKDTISIYREYLTNNAIKYQTNEIYCKKLYEFLNQLI
jgi:glycosyltransferase involved in cell wall biosynthesis